MRRLKHTAIFLACAACAFFSFRVLLKYFGVRPPRLGEVSSRWLYERRRADEQ